MRLAIAAVALLLTAPRALAAGEITCSQLPQAEKFVEGLKPGPNTSAAQRHIALAKSAKDENQCVTELGKVNYYAKRSLTADQRAASKENAAAAPPAEATAAAAPTVTSAPASASPALPPSSAPRPRPAAAQCADFFHQDRPGGSDYKGPPVPGCKKVF